MKYFGRTSATYFCQRLLSSVVVRHARPEYLSKLRECYRLEEHNKFVVPLFKKALLFGHKIAVKDFGGEYSYLQLYVNSKRLSRQISNICGSGSSSSVGFFFSNDVLTILCLWGCWMSGQVAVPLKSDYPYSMLQSMLTQSNAKMIITSKEHSGLARKLAQSYDLAVLSMDHGFVKGQNHSFNFSREIFMTDNLVFFEGLQQNDFYTNTNAMQVYFTGLDKDNKEWWKKYTLSHKHIHTQMKELVQVWNMSAEDHILNILPSLHVSGYIGTTLYPFTAGSTLQIHDPFNALKAWAIILGIQIPAKERVNVVIAEPNVYRVLVEEYDKIFAKNSRMVEYIKDYCSNKIRLMISCVEPLPSETFCRWLEITGHSVLENAYVLATERAEKPANEDQPMRRFEKQAWKLNAPNVKVRIVDSENNILLESHGMSRKKIHTTAVTVVGSLWISPPGEEGYVCTGEVVAYQDGIFRILGRYNATNKAQHFANQVTHNPL